MKLMRRFQMFAATMVALWSCASFAADAPEPEPKEEPIQIDEKTGDARMPGIRVHGKAQVVEVDGQICLNEGILEFFACTAGPDSREYESVVSLNCKPSHFKAALLLIECEEGNLSPEALNIKPDPGEKPRKLGTRVKISVEWKDGDKTVRVPADELMTSRRTGKPVKDLPWRFTGSAFARTHEGKVVFAGDIEGIFIAMLYAAAASVNLDVDAGNPYQGDADGFEINKKLIPKVGTPIKLFIEKAEK
jgi:hypothetical protein